MAGAASVFSFLGLDLLLTACVALVAVVALLLTVLAGDNNSWAVGTTGGAALGFLGTAGEGGGKKLSVPCSCGADETRRWRLDFEYCYDMKSHPG